MARSRRRCARACRGSPPRTGSRSRPRARPRSRRRIGAAGRGRARACCDRTPRSRFRIVESQLQEVGRSIHAAFPGHVAPPAARRSTQRAMELASQDAELRAALFRFVDVTPACRSLDDLARHLTGYLEEVDDRPPPIEAAMRMSGTKAGPRGARRGGGRRRAPHGAPLHRRRDARSAALKTIRHLWEQRGGRLARPARRGDGHPARGGPLRRALPRRARDPRRGGAGSWPERPVLEARLARPASRA